MKCEEKILTQLPLVGLADESVESLVLQPSNQLPEPMVGWAVDRKEYHRQYYLKNRRKVIERSIRWKRQNRERANAWTRNHRKGKTAQRTAEARDYRRRRGHVVRNSSRRRYSENPEKYRQFQRDYRKRNPESVRSKYRKWRIKNWDYVLRKKRERHQNDIRYAIECRLRGQLVKAVLRRKTSKAASTFALLGCSIDDFVKHLESQFLPGMTWENRNRWEIDHIRPVAAYDLTDPEQQRACFHWTNLRPLWAGLNRQKQDKIIS